MAQANPTRANGSATGDETTLTGHYVDCDYKFAVKLPVGVVAHTGVPSAHGFTVNPGSPASKETFSGADSRRFISVFPFYDVRDHEESTAGPLDYYSSLDYRGSEKNVERLNRKAFTLAGMHGVRIEDRLSGQSGIALQDTILEFRRQDGILYEFMLQTPTRTYAVDKMLFNRIVEGFRLSKIPPAECSSK